MIDKKSLKPVALAIGTTFAASLAGTSVANAADNPFGMTKLSSGYMVAQEAEGKCGGKKAEGEGKCGEGMKTKEGKCGEGKCGEGMMKSKEGKCGEGMKEKEGKCGGQK